MSDPHDELAPPLPACAPPWWEDGETLTATLKEPAMLSRGIMAFWQQIRRWLLISLGVVDPLTCSQELLALLAWERDIHRFTGEPLDLYRKRIKYAFPNAQDAGEVAPGSSASLSAWASAGARSTSGSTAPTGT